MNSYRKYTIIFSIAALFISTYTIQVTKAKQKDPSYQAVCDISERLSCSNVFTSDFGTGFGIVSKFLGKNSIINQPNGVYGLLLYTGIILCCLFSQGIFAKLQLLLVTIGFGFSTYGFINTFLLSPHICAVCVTGHSINYILFALGILNFNSTGRATQARASAKTNKRN